MGYYLRLADRVAHTTAFVTPVVENRLEQEIAQWVHQEGSIHEWMLFPRLREIQIYLRNHSHDIWMQYTGIHNIPGLLLLVDLVYWSVVGSILLSGSSCCLGYFPFQPVVHNWFIKGRGMYCSVYGKVHIKYPLLLIEKSSLCGGSGFPSKKCVNVTIWMTSNNWW